MSDRRRKIIEKINDLTVDFAFFLRNDICKTDSDYEYLEEHLDKAFACVPRSSDFPSQIIVSEINKQVAMKEIEEFVDRIFDLDSLSEGKMELTKREKEILYGLVHDHYEELYKGDLDAVKLEVSELYLIMHKLTTRKTNGTI